MQYKERVKEFEKRKEQSEAFIKKYPDRIPVICEKSNSSSAPDIDKAKYLVPKDVTVHHFSYIIRRRLRLTKEQTLWLFVNGKYAIKGDTLMSQVYEKMKDPDGFLYITYSGENVYGIKQ